jgi:hypothetical protein
MNDNKFGKDLEGSGRILIEVLFQHFPRGIDTEPKVYQSGYPVSPPRVRETNQPCTIGFVMELLCFHWGKKRLLTCCMDILSSRREKSV